MIAPVYRDNQMTVDGKIYGFPDDGDVFVMYYRKDVLTDPAIQDGLQGEVRQRPARAAHDLERVRPAVAVITETTGGKPYGCAFFRDPPYAQFMFQERFRNNGGRFFDAGTMKAAVNGPPGVQVFNDWLAENKVMPKGVETWGFVENLAAFLQGDSAMTISWPPYRRWAAGYGTDQEALAWVPKSRSQARSAIRCRPAGIHSSPPASPSASPRARARRTRPTCSSNG